MSKKWWNYNVVQMVVKVKKFCVVAEMKESPHISLPSKIFMGQAEHTNTFSFMKINLGPSSTRNKQMIRHWAKISMLLTFSYADIFVLDLSRDTSSNTSYIY